MSTHAENERLDSTIDAAEVYRRASELELSVYHGTRQSSAEGILRDGFHPTPILDQMAMVADAHRVPLDAVRAHLQRMRKFTHLDARVGTVSTTADVDRAGSWANRAPEATHEALWSVYALRHRELGDDYYQASEGHFWVMAQQMVDPPVVVEARASLAALRAWQFSAGKTAVEMLFSTLTNRSSSLEDFRWVFDVTPEWRVDIDQAAFLSAQPAQTRVFPHVLAYMSEQDLSALGDQVRQGRWGDPGGHENDGTQWWPFDAVWSRLTPQRRAQLEQIAGRALP